ncbi:MAG: hypothetical protein WD314_15360 [Trueperaceae bacterium]
MAMGARAGSTLVMVAVLLLAVALAVAGYFLVENRRAGTDEAVPLRGSSETPATGDTPAIDPEAGDRADSGGLEIRVAPSGARVAVIGPDRFVHASTQFGTATLGSLPAGEYLLSGTKDGYAASIQAFRVEPGELTSVALDLRRAGVR